MVNVCWLFYITKFIELLDTVSYIDCTGAQYIELYTSKLDIV